MTEHYRGHRIDLARTRFWEAVIIETETGITLPTKATALLKEGRSVALRRACKLIDLYLGSAPSEAMRAA